MTWVNLNDWWFIHSFCFYFSVLSRIIVMLARQRLGVVIGDWYVNLWNCYYEDDDTNVIRKSEIINSELLWTNYIYFTLDNRGSKNMTFSNYLWGSHHKFTSNHSEYSVMSQMVQTWVEFIRDWTRNSFKKWLMRFVLSRRIVKQLFSVLSPILTWTANLVENVHIYLVTKFFVACVKFNITLITHAHEMRTCS